MGSYWQGVKPPGVLGWQMLDIGGVDGDGVGGDRPPPGPPRPRSSPPQVQDDDDDVFTMPRKQ